MTVSPPRSTRRATRSASSRTPPRGSAGSPRRPRSRSCCSGSATPRTTSGSASSPARRATSSPASSSRAATPTTCWSTSASSRRCCRWPSGCRGRSTSTAPGSSAWSSRSARACAARRSRCRARTPTWSRSCSRSRCPRSPTAPSRSRPSPARPATAPRSRCTPTPGVNAKGACIGPMGQRVRNVMSELHGEKIDIVDWSEDPAEMVAHALSPARVTSVEVVDADARSARVVVPDFQLSLAIGKEGQNARLAARLTGWRIDIRSDEEAPRPPSPSGCRPSRRRRRGPRPSPQLSSGVGSASIRQAGRPSPMAPPWDTTSTVSPGWASATSRSTAPNRSAISRPDSPPGIPSRGHRRASGGRSPGTVVFHGVPASSPTRTRAARAGSSPRRRAGPRRSRWSGRPGQACSSRRGRPGGRPAPRRGRRTGAGPGS